MALMVGLLVSFIDSVFSAQVYLEPEKFLEQAFDGEIPKAKKIYVKGEIRKKIESILGHKFRGIRIKYWAKGERTAWILEEIGKAHPITTGYLVDQGSISKVRVLIYRETRGWEVKRPSFTIQFEGATHKSMEYELDREINNISGATLSVRALTKLARIALYLDDAIKKQAKK